jgi:hypothetical protein
VVVHRRVTPHLEVPASLAYFDLSADLRVTLLQQVRTASRVASWVDPLVGLDYRHYELIRHGPGAGIAFHY